MSIKERREREEQSRLAAILVAAESIFIEKGYHNARMDDIAEAAELAKGTLYYYFKSKDEIYLHLLKREARQVHEEIRRRISESSSFLEILEKAFNFYVEYFDRNPGFLKMFLPCMCGFVRFEDAGAVRDSARTYDDHAGFIRAALRKTIRKEGLPFKLEELEKFIQTMQIGISLMLLENRKAEAGAAVKFFLDLIRHVMEESL
jgi:AcrR family transcriptional regulator